MDNAINGVNLTVIAQESLPVLQARLAPINLFTTNFSNEVTTVGSGVTTRVATAMTAGDYSRTAGYGISAASSSVFTVVLNKHKHYTVGFDDSEVGNTSLPVLQSTFIQPAINAICNSVQADLFALMTTAFPAYYSGAYASFGFGGITAGAKILDNSGSNTPRAALLGTNLFYDVLDDIKGIYSAGSEALRNGQVGVLGNVSTALVPSATFSGYTAGVNTSGLAGFIGGKDSLLIAARLPGVPSGNVQVANVTDPNSGFTVQLRQWYSLDDGMWKISAVSIYGVLRGNTSSGARIITVD